MLPNIPWAIGSAGGMIHTIPLLSHYWSLGVEEQFYAFWPFLIKYVNKLKLFLIGFCFFFVGLKFALKLMHAPATILSLVYYTRFSCMIIGAIGAYFFYVKNKNLKIVTNKYVEIVSWILLMLLLLNCIKLYPIIANEIVSVLTLILIFNQVSNPKPLISLETKLFDYLGKISFGLYVYNPLVIYLISFCFLYLKINSDFLKIILIIVLNFSVVIFIAHISYHYFEKRFLKMKLNYATIQSAASSKSENLL